MLNNDITAGRRTGTPYHHGVCMEALETRALMAAGLVAAYAFNEGSGASVVDISGSGNSGNISNAAWTTGGKYGNALSFNGSNSWVTIADNASLRLTSRLTLEAWVKPSSRTGWQTVFMKERPGSFSYALYSSDDTSRPPAAYINTGGDFKTVGMSALPLNSWTHLAATYDGFSFKLYVNGTQVGRQYRMGSLVSATGALRIGGNSVWGEYFSGLIDEVRIYNRALTQAEIQSDMNTPLVSTADTTPPAVSIASPAPGSTVSGSVIISANASDDVGVAGVQFLLDGVSLDSEDTTAPYTFPWNTTAVANGPHVLSAIARDAAGNRTTSSSVSVMVNNGVPDTTDPVVSIINPVDDSSVSGTVTVSANASDNLGVAGVQFKLNGANLGSEDTAAPYSISWNTLALANGLYELTAIARDAAGNSTTSSPITIRVNNPVPDTTPPTVSITAPSNGSTVSGTLSISAAATDNVGVSQVQFLLDGANLGSPDASSPYAITWNTQSVSNGSHYLQAVARDAAGNVATSLRVNVTVANSGNGVTLNLDGSQQYQRIDGFGVNANSASWNGGQLRPAIDQLVDQMGATLWRVVVESTRDWETTNDDDDPFNFNWAYYNALYETSKFQDAWDLIAYLNSKGVQVAVNVMGGVPIWMGGSNISNNAEDEWVEMVSSFLYYGKQVRHVRMNMISPLNEQDYGGAEGPTVSSTQYIRLMDKLVARMQSLGLTDIRILGPDTANVDQTVDDYYRAMFADSSLMAYVDHLTVHNYGGTTYDAPQEVAASGYPGRNVWVTEFAAPVFQQDSGQEAPDEWQFSLDSVGFLFNHLSDGAAGALVWDGYDSTYEHSGYSVWGMLKYDQATGTYTPRKRFYAFAQVMKFVEPGSVRIAAMESNSYLTAYAFYNAATGDVTIVGENTSGAPLTIRGSLAGLPASQVFELYQTNSTVNLQRGADVPVSNGAFSATISPGSLFTLTTPAIPDTMPPAVGITSPASGALVSGPVALSAEATDDV
ncbi:MAG TPA: Ig-like domain-containing protein, partial [Tepidisphaeraceae bacterium]|nr:Ig-like domain-containing protein [Tepidisphaeraceae bacterium]